jgi:hypothetical protein
MGNIGHFNLENIFTAGMLLQDIPEDIADAARNPLTAKAVFYAVLFDGGETIRQKQLEVLTATETTFVVRQSQQIFLRLRGVAENIKIPLVQRVTASLRQLTAVQYKQFSSVVDALIAADQKMSLFEYTLKAILLRDLDIEFGFAKPLSVRYSTIQSVRQQVTLVLSYFAYAGHSDSVQTQNAFQAAIQELGLNVPIQPAADCTVPLFDQSLRILALTAPALKKQIFNALIICIRYDGRITEKENELIRATAAMLAIPMPNFESIQ